MIFVYFLLYTLLYSMLTQVKDTSFSICSTNGEFLNLAERFKALFQIYLTSYDALIRTGSHLDQLVNESIDHS